LSDLDSFFGEIKKSCKVPALADFGISDTEQAAKIGSYCGGIVAGSAIVEIVEKYGQDSVQKVGEFVSSLKKAVK
jgi:tryptophan synthase alpha chain